VALSGRVRVTVAAVVVLVLVALAAFYVVRRLDRSPLENALDLVPAGSLRVGFTDWKLVRDRLKPGGLTTDKGIERFMTRGYDSDLTAASSIDESAVALHDKYGFSPVNADWEAYAQSRKGAAMLLQLPGGTDMGAIEDRLDKLGYQRPSSDTGVWDGGIDLVSGIDATISPELQYVVVDADHHRIVSSDTHAYAAVAGQVSTGKADGLGSSVHDLLGHTSDPAAAYLWSRDFACEDLAMTSAASADQARASRLVDRAGGVDPLSGLLVTMTADRTLDVVLGFADDRQARDNLRPRADLYVGPAVSREGSYADDLRLTRSRTDGSAVVLTLKPKARTGFALSEIDSGPVLFATC
jgi:hypothetical protein